MSHRSIQSLTPFYSLPGSFVVLLVMGVGAAYSAEGTPPPVVFRSGPVLRKGADKPAQKTEGPVPAEPSAGITPEARRRAALEKASALATAGNLQAALKIADEVRVNPEDEGFSHELRGTLLASVKDYAGAEASFRAMLKKTDQSPVANFNVAEMVMLQGRYGEAEERFRYIEEKSRNSDPALADLCRFKRVVCLAASLQLPEADSLCSPANEGSIGSPGAQYSRAIVQCARKEFAKASLTIEELRSQFSPEVENLYVDSFVEMRWGKRDENGVFVIEAQSGPRSEAKSAGAVVAGFAETPAAK